MKRADALHLGQPILEHLTSLCYPGKCLFAGSLRRQEDHVGDVEIIAQPILSNDLFGEPLSYSAAIENALQQLRQSKQVSKPLLNGPRYKKFFLGNKAIVLDLFIILPSRTWGILLAIRTGPEKFSRQLVTPRRQNGFLPSSCIVRNGQLWKHNKLIPTPTEQAFFAAIELQWIEPHERNFTSITRKSYIYSTLEA